MDNTKLAYFILVFWSIFAIVLLLLGYANAPNPSLNNGMYNDFTSQQVLNSANNLDNLFNPFLSNVTLPNTSDCSNTLDCALSNIASFFISLLNIIIQIINLLAFILRFLWLIIQTMLLTFGDINFYLARFINLIQILSLIFVAMFIRGHR